MIFYFYPLLGGLLVIIFCFFWASGRQILDLVLPTPGDFLFSPSLRGLLKIILLVFFWGFLSKSKLSKLDDAD